MDGVTTLDKVNSQDLEHDLAQVFRTRRLQWHGQTTRSAGWLTKVQNLSIKSVGGRGRSRPKKTWTEEIHLDCIALGLIETLPSDRKTWSGTIKTAVRLAPPLYQSSPVLTKLGLDDYDDDDIN